MALIAMAVYDSGDGVRKNLTLQTLVSMQGMNWGHHRLVVVNNGGGDEMTRWLSVTMEIHPYDESPRGTRTRIDLPQNIGTAAAINKVWKLRRPGEMCVKMDDDVVIHQRDWANQMEEVIAIDPTIGIVGLKRKDLEERPDHPIGFYRSGLRMLKHEPGHHWIVVEEVQHVMGTCQMYSAALLDKIGYLYQMQDMGNLYGFDDSLASLRAHIAGFKTVFLPSTDIDHIDPGGTKYTAWKAEMAGHWMGTYQRVRDEYLSGARPIYWEDK